MSGAAHDSQHPAVDERLVAPESRYEVMDGRVEYVAPADEPHGRQHSKILALLEAHVRSDYAVAADMLTRTSAMDDIAPDASVYPRARNPETGQRKLEELAFEIASTESLAHAGRKAAKLVARGVRRVFAIDVERQRAVEWSTETASWRILDQDSVIDDETLAAALPVRALVTAAEGDDAMAVALLAKQNRVLIAAVEQGELRGRQEGELRGRQEGELRGKAEAVLAVLAARGLTPTAAERQALLDERAPARLAAWLRACVCCETVGELLDV